MFTMWLDDAALRVTSCASLWWWSDPGYGFQITFHFFYRCGIEGFRTTLGKMTYAGKMMNPQHFGSNPTDVRIRIQINPEILIRIPDHFWWRFALFEHSLVIAAGVILYYFLSVWQMSEGRKTKIVLLDDRHLEILVQVNILFLSGWFVAFLLLSVVVHFSFVMTCKVPCFPMASI